MEAISSKSALIFGAIIVCLAIGALSLMVAKANKIPSFQFSEKWGISDAEWQTLAPTAILTKAHAETKFSELLLAAQNGDVEAMVLSGLAFDWGIGVPKNENDAAHWYRVAADSGNSYAMLSLGIMQAEGRGFAKNETVAARWFHEAAEAGSSQAMVYYGAMLANGKGVAKDEALAVRWFRASADAGNLSGMVILGNALATGQGISKNEREAAHWYRIAAEGGDGYGMYQLGNLLARGADIARKPMETTREWQDKQAKHWWCKAVSKGGNPAIDAANALEKVYGINDIAQFDGTDC